MIQVDEILRIYIYDAGSLDLTMSGKKMRKCDGPRIEENENYGNFLKELKRDIALIIRNVRKDYRPFCSY